MESITWVAFLAIGFAYLVFDLQKQNRNKQILDAFFFTLASLLLIEDQNPEGQQLLYSGIAFVVVGAALASIKKLHRHFLRLIFPIFSLIILLAVFKDHIVLIGGQESSLVNKFVIGGAILAVVMFELGYLKNLVLTKLGMKGVDVNEAVEHLLVGIALYLAFFGADYMGVYLISVLIMINGFFQQFTITRYQQILIFLFAYPLLIEPTGGMVLNVLQPDMVLMSLLAVFMSAVPNALRKVVSGMLLLSTLFIFLSSSVIIGVIMAGDLYESLGGVDAAVAYLLIFALLSIRKEEANFEKAAFAVGLFVVLLTPKYLSTAAPDQDQQKVTTEQVQKIEKEITYENLPLSSDLGKFKIVADSSKVDFKLGTKVITKGAFKKVNGDINLKEQIESSTFNITLAMSDFTTFNSIRDKSLMGDEYFKTDKFPEMSYKANSLRAEGDNNFRMDGEFTMLGKSLPVEVTAKRIDKSDDQIWLTGSGELDRTKFGMTPSATEGNIVQFTYTVLLQK